MVINKLEMGLVLAGSALLFSGCATKMSGPPLMEKSPEYEAVPSISKLQVPEKPDFQPMELRYEIPKELVKGGSFESIVSAEAKFSKGTSVVINVPALAKMKPVTGYAATEAFSGAEFVTARNFHRMEQSIEKALLLSGFTVKDRQKFEAFLRETTQTELTPDELLNVCRLLNASSDRDELAKQILAVRKKYEGTPQEDWAQDICKLINAGKAGEIQTDYILQVNKLKIQNSPLDEVLLMADLKANEETLKLLEMYPELSHQLPESIPVNMYEAVFNAALINVKTGSIDWIGDYTVNSVWILDDAVEVSAVVAQSVANETVLHQEVDNYNSTLTKAHKGAVKAYDRLMAAIEEACAPISYRVKLKDEDEKGAEKASREEDAENEGAVVVEADEAAVEGSVNEELIQAAMQEQYDKLQEKVDEAAAQYKTALADLKEVVEGREDAISSSWVISRDLGVLKRTPELQDATTTERNDHLSKLVDEAAKTLISSIKSTR